VEQVAKARAADLCQSKIRFTGLTLNSTSTFLKFLTSKTCSAENDLGIEHGQQICEKACSEWAKLMSKA